MVKSTLQTVTTSVSIMGSSVKVPLPEQSHPPARKRVTLSDALRYMQAVKDTFKDNHAKYDAFVDIMKDVTAKKVSTTRAMERAEDLFRGNRELILGFNAFLPEGYEIALPPSEDLRPTNRMNLTEIEPTYVYLRKIRTRLARDKPVLEAFLGILSLCGDGYLDFAEAYEDVTHLFAQHYSDLVEGFANFLPDSVRNGM